MARRWIVAAHWAYLKEHDMRIVFLLPRTEIRACPWRAGCKAACWRLQPGAGGGLAFWCCISRAFVAIDLFPDVEICVFHRKGCVYVGEVLRARAGATAIIFCRPCGDACQISIVPAWAHARYRARPPISLPTSCPACLCPLRPARSGMDGQPRARALFQMCLRG